MMFLMFLIGAVSVSAMKPPAANASASAGQSAIDKFQDGAKPVGNNWMDGIHLDLVEDCEDLFKIHRKIEKRRNKTYLKMEKKILDMTKAHLRVFDKIKGRKVCFL